MTCNLDNSNDHQNHQEIQVLKGLKHVNLEKTNFSEFMKCINI